MGHREVEPFHRRIGLCELLNDDPDGRNTKARTVCPRLGEGRSVRALLPNRGTGSLLGSYCYYYHSHSTNDWLSAPLAWLHGISKRDGSGKKKNGPGSLHPLSKLMVKEALAEPPSGISPRSTGKAEGGVTTGWQSPQKLSWVRLNPLI